MNRDRWMPLSSLIFVTVYAVALYFKLGLFVVTLKPEGIVFFNQPHPPFKDMLPMFFFGWTATAIIVTAIAAILLRYLLVRPLRIPPTLYWLIPTASAISIVYSQLSWFNK